MESTSFPIAELVPRLVMGIVRYSTPELHPHLMMRIVDVRYCRQTLFAFIRIFFLPFRALCFMGLGIINQKYLSPQILQEYVNLVEDVDTKLNLATKFKCHDVVIDVSPQEIRTLS